MLVFLISSAIVAGAGIYSWTQSGKEQAATPPVPNVRICDFKVAVLHIGDQPVAPVDEGVVCPKETPKPRKRPNWNPEK